MPPGQTAITSTSSTSASSTRSKPWCCRIAAASDDPFVLQTIRNAEALFIAGGDQSNYVDFWKGTPVEDAIHELAAREIPIAGTSAGTAILSEFIYAAQRQSAVSSKALADPFHHDITLDRDFLHLPHMGGLITDQHLIERDRLGRTLAFMARIVQDGWQAESRSIAIDRETAVLVDASGDATIVANPDHPTPYAYFIRGGTPEVCQPKVPLTYRNLAVFRAEPGTRFDIPSWSGHNGTLATARRRRRRRHLDATRGIDLPRVWTDPNARSDCTGGSGLSARER